MDYFVGTEKVIMVNYDEIEILEIEADYLYIGFKSGNNARLKVDIENLTEVIKSGNYYLYNKNDIRINDEINKIYDELRSLKRKYEKFTADYYPSRYTDFEAMNEIDSSRYEFLEESMNNLKYSFEN